MADKTLFEEDEPRGDRLLGDISQKGALVLSLTGYEGPIDVLLTLSREQKVDLRHISILQLAEQYLSFIHEMRRRRLELAADYLVMAAWLAYLKSRLLLPEKESDEEPSGEEMAAALAFQLQRLQAMQDSGEKLMEGTLIGRDVYRRGAPEGVEVIQRSVFDVTLYDLLKAYADHVKRHTETHLEIEEQTLYTVDQALRRLREMVGYAPDWTKLHHFLPEELETPLLRRSALSATFVAVLEMAKQGSLEIRQDGGAFAPLFLRHKTPPSHPQSED